MKPAVPANAIVVSEESHRSINPEDIVQSNVTFVNALLDEYVAFEEISSDALRSYYVDYYVAEFNNGGFSQFVYNSKWESRVVKAVREGLQAIGARLNLQLFDAGAKEVEQLGVDRLKQYFSGDYFGKNLDRDRLNSLNSEFVELSKTEDILALNAAWLRRVPHLVTIKSDEMGALALEGGKALPDRERRIAQARANEPRYMKLIRKLCDNTNCALVCVTAGDPTRVHEGENTLAWHFITDKGHHHMIEANGKAIMFRGHSTTDRVYEMESIA